MEFQLAIIGIHAALLLDALLYIHKETPTETTTPATQPPAPISVVNYTITFVSNAESATGTTESITAPADTIINLPENGFSLEGYNFTGWNTEPDGSGTGYADEANLKLTGNLKLYAQWILETVPTYGIFVDCNASAITVSVSQSVAESGTEIIVSISHSELYEIESVFINEYDTNITNNAAINPENPDEYRFIMPKSDVLVRVNSIFLGKAINFYVDNCYYNVYIGGCNLNGYPSYNYPKCAKPGKEMTLNFYPEEGFIVSFWIKRGNENGEFITNQEAYKSSEYKFIMPEDSVYIHITFIPIPPDPITVTFDTDCSIEILPLTVVPGELIAEPTLDTSGMSERSGFCYWYYYDYDRYSNGKPVPGSELKLKEYDFSKPCEKNEDFTLYAHWEYINGTYEYIKNTKFKYRCKVNMELPENSDDLDIVLEKYEISDLNIPNQKIKSISLTGCGIYSTKIPDGTEFVSLICCNCNNLEIPDGVKTIGSLKFCTFKSISIPSSVESIGDLYGCDNLTSLTIPGSVKSIGSLYNCSSLKSIIISNGVETIGDFACCSELTDLTIPKSVTSIKNTCPYLSPYYNFKEHYKTFEGCTKLTNLYFYAEIESIDEDLFARLCNLKKLVISDSVKSIAAGALKDCYSLEDLTIPFVGGSANPTDYGETTCFGYIFGKEKDAEKREIVQYWTNEPKSLQNHGSYSNFEAYRETFYVPKKLDKIKISGGTIMDYAFFIESGAFYPSTVIIGKNVTRIGMYCFRVHTGTYFHFYDQCIDNPGEYTYCIIRQIIFEQNSTWKLKLYDRDDWATLLPTSYEFLNNLHEGGCFFEKK